MSSELVSVVDEQDNVIGVKPRRDLNPSDIVRITSLWVENSQGQVLLAKRSLNKSIGPGCWGPAAAGTVEADETYRSNIIKEAAEEIGLFNFEPIEIAKRLMLNFDSHYGRMVTFFETKIDRPLMEFKIDESEVAQIKWADKKTVLTHAKKNPSQYVGSARLWEELFY